MKKKIKIVSDNKIPLFKGVFEAYADIDYYPGKEITKDKIIDADALIIRTRTKCNRELLEGTNIKLIATATIGFDHIDTDYCKVNNIKWVNAPGCNSSSVQQYIASSLLYLATAQNFNLNDKTIGIVGVGNVGQKIQKIAEIFGMKILLNDPPRARMEGKNNFVDLDEIISEGDIITFHVPLYKDGIDKTFHLADEKFFDQLKQKQIIINTSRGEVIKTDALKDAITKNKISSVILDVWENEPEIDLQLLAMAIISTPHIAGYSADGKANGTSVCVNAVNNFFDLGLPQNWYPSYIPDPDGGNSFELNCSNLNLQEILHDAVTKTYNIKNDSEKLKKSPGTFEKQRGDYPIRREFHNYSIKLVNGNPTISKKLGALGFKVFNN